MSVSSATAAGGAALDRPAHLLFSSDRTGTWRLYAVNTDGSDLADLSPPAAVLSPDGRVLLLEASGGIVRVSGDGRFRRKIGSGRPLAVSPDGKRVAFLNVDNQNNEVIGVLDLDGSHRRVLVRSGQAEDRLVAWFADSSSLLVLRSSPTFLNSGDRLLEASVRGGRPRTVLQGPFDSPVLSARGVLAFIRPPIRDSAAKLLVLDLTRAKPAMVVATAATISGPQWSPDGRQLSFVRQDKPTSATRKLVLASAGRTKTLLSSAYLVDSGPWSPNGDALAALVGYHSGPQLVVVGLDGRIQARVRSKNASGLQWSPDGALIAFGQGLGDLFVVRRDGSALRQLTTAGHNELLGWAPGSVPQTAPRATPLPPTETVTGLTLRTRGRVRELAADGPWVAAIVARTRRVCDHVVAWRAGGTTAVRFGSSRPCDGNEEFFGLGLTGTTITWHQFDCGNDCYLTPISADTRRPGSQAVGPTDDVGNSAPAPRRPAPPAETHKGISFSMLHGLIRLKRLADGHAITIRPPGQTADAELEDAGLFYAYNVARSRAAGRVVFVPLSELNRRLG